MSLRVLTPGTFSLLVDQGRPTSRRLGLPLSGPADRTSMILANALLGNESFAPALEMTLSGPTVVAEVDVGLCVMGAPFTVQIDGKEIQSGASFTLKAGQTLRMGGTPKGCRAYLCVVGGFANRSVLESQSAFEPLCADTILRCKTSTVAQRWLSPDDVLGATRETQTLRCLRGPQANWFDETFWANNYTVLSASNRMGIRLEGIPLTMPKRELVSEAVAPGAIQMTNDGKPIVLGVEGQTIGGYSKIAHVIDADLDIVGQLRPGAEVRFVSVTEDEAEIAGATYRQHLRQLRRRIRFALS
jgi:biotin-dependent carboxylase-like uncharacterized protein